MVPGDPRERGPRADAPREVDGMQVIDAPDIASALRVLAARVRARRARLRATDL